MTFDLDLLTWISIEIIYLSRTMYLPSWKLLVKGFFSYPLLKYKRPTWPLTYWPEYIKGSSTHQVPSNFQIWSFLGKAFLSYLLHKVKGDRPTYWTIDLPTCAKQYAPPSAKGGIIMSARAGVYTLYIIKVPNSIFSITAENWNIRNKWWNKSTTIGFTCLPNIVTYYLS